MMAERIFSLEAVLALREAELEAAERELANIGIERAREQEKTREMRQRKAAGMASIEDVTGKRDIGFLVALYGWLEHMDLRIREQEQKERFMDGEFERVRGLWKKARMEKEKVLILRERFRGDERRRALRIEERSLEIWIEAREANRKLSGRKDP